MLFAMPTFAYSIFYLAALFAAMLIDHFYLPMSRGIFITVASCLGLIALILALFLSRFYTPRELTQDEYKMLGAYFIDPPRQLSEFQLIDDEGVTFLQNNLRTNGIFYFLVLLIALIFAL